MNRPRKSDCQPELRDAVHEPLAVILLKPPNFLTGYGNSIIHKWNYGYAYARVENYHLRKAICEAKNQTTRDAPIRIRATGCKTLIVN